jgi:hypothetical protein
LQANCRPQALLPLLLLLLLLRAMHGDQGLALGLLLELPLLFSAENDALIAGYVPPLQQRAVHPLCLCCCSAASISAAFKAVANSSCAVTCVSG